MCIRLHCIQSEYVCTWIAAGFSICVEYRALWTLTCEGTTTVFTFVLTSTITESTLVHVCGVLEETTAFNNQHHVFIIITCVENRCTECGDNIPTYRNRCVSLLRGRIQGYSSTCNQAPSFDSAVSNRHCSQGTRWYLWRKKDFVIALPSPFFSIQSYSVLYVHT